MKLLSLTFCLALSACGTAYISPAVTSENVVGLDVRVVPLTVATVTSANQAGPAPRALPAAFAMQAGLPGGPRGAHSLPTPPLQDQARPAAQKTRLPPDSGARPYTIGVGDVLTLATPKGGEGVEELAGILAAQTRRQGFTVQDDGAITVPDIGRIQVVGLTLREAEDEVFDRLVGNQMDPAFGLEIAEFNSKRVPVGGAVLQPGVVPITLTPPTLDQVLAQVGGVVAGARDFGVVRLYREGDLYQVPLSDRTALGRVRVQDGDSLFVDTAYDLDRAQAYFAQQIKLSEENRAARRQALDELETKISLRRAALDEARAAFLDRLELGAEPRDYAYLAGEVKAQGRVDLPFGRRATLAEALYGAGGVPTRSGNPAQIYILRGGADPTVLTAYHLDARNAAALVLATRMQLLANDVIFVTEQPVTRWSRALQQITPSFFFGAARAADGA
ncbi:MAG: polysaccharide biosynthesis/export family protein [Rhodobacteraceae bacterium]|nr:polysaccharide biosynthesis/export family protein [Paracoccaceae bacterium]